MATYSMKIEYMKVNMQDYYQTRGSFIASKLFQKFLEAFVNKGKIIYDNLTLTGDLNCTERGLQYAFKQLEDADLFHREFTDETKINRTGFKMNLDEVLEIVKLKPKHVANLKRGDIKKSIVTQMVLTLKRDVRGLRKALTIAKREQNQAKVREIQDELNGIKEEYRLHVEHAVNRYEYFRSLALEPATLDEVNSVFDATLLTWNFEPPELNQN